MKLTELSDEQLEVAFENMRKPSLADRREMLEEIIDNLGITIKWKDEEND